MVACDGAQVFSVFFIVCSSIIAICAGGVYIDAAVHFKATHCKIMQYVLASIACPPPGGGGVYCIIKYVKRDSGSTGCVNAAWNVRINDTSHYQGFIPCWRQQDCVF